VKGILLSIYSENKLGTAQTIPKNITIEIINKSKGLFVAPVILLILIMKRIQKIELRNDNKKL
jgi:hypothetical protein